MGIFKLNWWKLLTILLVFYTIIGGLLFNVPRLPILNETIRALYFHLITGMIWTKFTWSSAWSGDPKQNGAAITLLIYLAYMVLRNSIEDEQKRARISAVYNIFAFAALIPLLFILPRMTDSLHPGSGGNPGFNAYDLDSKMRMVFYPAIAGWTLLGVWISTLRIRIKLILIY